MLSRKYKLGSGFFAGLRQSGSRVIESKTVRQLSIKVYSSKLPYSRCAAVIGSQAIKKSTERNRIRRIVYEYVRSSGLWRRPGRDVVIYIKSSCAGANKKEIEASLVNTLS